MLGGFLERSVGAVRETGEEVDDAAPGGLVGRDVHDDGAAGPIVVGRGDHVSELRDLVSGRIIRAHRRESSPVDPPRRCMMPFGAAAAAPCDARSTGPG